MILFCSHDLAGPETLLTIYARDSRLVGRRHELDSSATVITVGRQRENTITLDSDTVSRRHARFERRADGWWVVDTNSAHGTFVNGDRASEALLRRGDPIQIGDTIYKLACDLCQQAVDAAQYRRPT